MAARGSRRAPASRRPKKNCSGHRRWRAALGCSTPRASKPIPSPTGPRRRTGFAGTAPSRSPPEHKEAWPKMRWAGRWTYHDLFAAGMQTIRHIRETPAPRLCSRPEKKKSEKFHHIRQPSPRRLGPRFSSSASPPRRRTCDGYRRSIAWNFRDSSSSSLRTGISRALHASSEHTRIVADSAAPTNISC